MIKEILINFGSLFCDLMSTVIVIQILLSWFVPPGNNFYQFLNGLTRPVLGFFRKITPKTGMIDLSPLIALLALDIARTVWIYLLTGM